MRYVVKNIIKKFSLKKYFSFIKPGIFEFFILAMFFLGSSCLETFDVFSQLGIYVNRAADVRRMVELDGKLYIANSKLHIIEQVDISTGVKVVWAGSSGLSGATEGALASARFNTPSGIIYRSGVAPKFYIADRNNCTIRVIDINTQMVSTEVGSLGACANTDGVGTAARLAYPTDLVISGSTMYISQQACNIRKLDLSTLQVTSPIGINGTCGNTNAIGTAATFGNSAVTSLTIVGSTLFVADVANNVIRAVNTGTLVVTSFSGTGSSGFADGNSVTAQFKYINGITSDGNTYLFVSDFLNNSIRQINATTGEVSTILGDVNTNQDIDGTPSSAKLTEPLGIGFSTYGLFFASRDSIRRMH